jgi:hypothetical protein
LRQTRAPVLMLASISHATLPQSWRGAHPVANLLTHLQHAGLALHAGARVSQEELKALDVAIALDGSATSFTFVLSREGNALEFAVPALHRALEDRSGKPDSVELHAELMECTVSTAEQLLAGTAGGKKLKSSVHGEADGVDLFSYTAFALKNELL